MKIQNDLLQAIEDWKNIQTLINQICNTHKKPGSQLSNAGFQNEPKQNKSNGNGN